MNNETYSIVDGVPIVLGTEADTWREQFFAQKDNICDLVGTEWELQ